MGPQGLEFGFNASGTAPLPSMIDSCMRRVCFDGGRL